MLGGGGKRGFFGGLYMFDQSAYYFFVGIIINKVYIIFKYIYRINATV